MWATCAGTSGRVPGPCPAPGNCPRLRAPYSPLVAARPPARPTGPSRSRARGAFRRRPETRSPGSAAFPCVGERAGGRARVCVCASVCVCVRVCVRARGAGVRGSQIPLGAHRALCLRLRPLPAPPLARGPGFRISCLFNERKEQKAGGEGAEGAGEAVRAPGRACSERDTERSLRCSGGGRRAMRVGARMTAPPEPQGLHGVPGRQLGNPTAKVRSARGLPAPAVREAGRVPRSILADRFSPASW